MEVIYSFKGVVLALFMVSLFTTLNAATLPLDQHRQELTIQGLYLVPDDQRTEEYGTGLRASYGFQTGRHTWVEGQVFANILETGNDRISDAYQQGLGLDLAYRFLNDHHFDPFVLIGGGLSRNDHFGDNTSEIGGFGNLGAGVLSAPFTESALRLRAEARYLYDTYDDGRSDFHFGIGLTLPIGLVRERTIEREVIVERTTVRDQADSDGDGVVDGVDQCPNTLPGLKVDGRGCATTTDAQAVVLRGVTFEFNSAELTMGARERLIRAADALLGQPDLEIEIAGHTDNVGSGQYNQALSEARAESVRQYLIDLGVAPDRMTAKGYGPSQPRMSNETEAGRDRNRRVEFRILAQESAS